MRNRRLESFLDTNSTPNGKQTPKIVVREEVIKSPKSDVYVEDDGWISALISCVRIVVCFFVNDGHNIHLVLDLALALTMAL